MIAILSLKRATNNPADGIDNFNRAIFTKMDPDKIIFYTSGDVVEKGAMKKISGSVLTFLLTHRPNIIWGNGNIKELPLVLVARLFSFGRIKYIINFHTVLLRRSGPWGVRTPWFLRKILFNHAAIIICPSEFSAESVQRYFPYKKVISILNGVELCLFNPVKKNESYLQQKYNLDFSSPIVAFVGVLSARKRPDLFIRLAREMPQVRFIAVGRSLPEFDCLSATCDMNNFQWVESMTREDIAIFLASVAVFVFPSLNDASAAVILEAMASGAVPLVSKSGGNSEFFQDGESGFLVAQEQNEKEMFLEKIKMLLHNQELRTKLSLSARSEAGKHAWDAVAKQYEEAITSL
jgi:glycosyltransferase involved in cell wall biosynthesis